MMIGRLIGFALLVLAPTLVSSCADEARAANAVGVDYGTVEAIEIYRASDNKPLDAGTVLGGVAGGVIGHQIGSGRGKTAATIAGTIGGAVVGRELEKKVNGSRSRITVRLDSGASMIIEEAREVELRIGDRVRVENDRVFRL
jgi:outer membrane lipoprotein SlyB